MIDANNASVVRATVELKEMKALTIRPYVTRSDGSFRFGPLSTDTDYEVRAALNGRKSVSKFVSSFDTQATVDRTLKIE